MHQSFVKSLALALLSVLGLTSCGDDGLKERASRGDPSAQYQLAITPDLLNSKEGDRLLMLSAAQGYAPAQFEVGNAYLGRRSAESNSRERAIFWLRKASERGELRASAKLTGVYLGEHGGDVNIAMALAHLPEDTSAMSPESSHRLFLATRVKPLDEVWSRKLGELLEAGATKGHPGCSLEFAKVLMTREATAELDKRILILLLKAAEAGIPEASRLAGMRMLKGVGASKQPVDGAKLILAAAEKGDADAACEVFDLLVDGKYLPKNHRKAHDLVMAGAQKSHPTSARLVAKCHGRGIGVPRDEFAMMDWLRRAANFGDIESMMVIGEILLEGAGNQQRNSAEALFFYNMAAKAGEVRAHYKLFEIYSETDDYLAAYKALWEGVRLKDTRAMHRLGVVYEEGELGLAPNEQQALNYYLQGAQLNDPICKAYAGWLMVNAKTLKHNYPEGIRYLTEAHRGNVLLAHYTLGAMRLVGDGLDQDPEEAFFLASLAYLQAPESEMFSKLVAEAGSKLSSERRSRVVERSKRWIANEGSDERESADESASSTGSGIIFHNDGLVLTNHHVIETGGSIRVLTSSGAEFDGEVIASDAKLDVAVVRLSGRFVAEGYPHPPRLGGGKSAKTGQKVFTIGHPLADILSAEAKYTEGTVSALSGLGDNNDLLQVSVPIQPGNSGGPLAAESGDVIGLIVATVNGRYMLNKRGILPQNVNFAIKWEPIEAFLKEHGIAVPSQPAGGDAIERVKAYSVRIEVRR